MALVSGAMKLLSLWLAPDRHAPHQPTNDFTWEHQKQGRFSDRIQQNPQNSSFGTGKGGKVVLTAPKLDSHRQPQVPPPLALSRRVPLKEK